MTESQWLTEASRPQMMANALGDLRVARTKAGRRRLRLFACGCCRVAWDVLPDDRLRDAVVAAERFADGLASKDELAAARAAVEGMRADSGRFGRSPTRVLVAIDMAAEAADPSAYEAAFYMTATTAPLGGAVRSADARLCDLFRCAFGNPFRPAAFDPAWRTAAAVGVARGIYDDRAFDRLPILADAVEDAGCDDPDVLAHCRGAGPHARGCWVVDRVLGHA